MEEAWRGQEASKSFMGSRAMPGGPMGTRWYSRGSLARPGGLYVFDGFSVRARKVNKIKWTRKPREARRPLNCSWDAGRGPEARMD